MLSSLIRLAVLLPVLLYVFRLLPVSLFILPSMRLDEADRPHMFMSPESMWSYSGNMPTPFVVKEVTVPLTFQVGPLNYLLIITAAEESVPLTTGEDNSSNPVAVDALSEWYLENENFFLESLNEYGGVLFRNFNLKSSEDFDQVFGNFHPDMLNSKVCSCDKCIVIDCL